MSEEKHNGKLSVGSALSSEAEVRWDGSYISIRSGRNIVILDTKQASSLLAWLRQEEALEMLPEAATIQGYMTVVPRSKLAQKILTWIEDTRKRAERDEKSIESHPIDRFDILVDDIEKLCRKLC